jgi:hypothetical protein
MSSLVYKLFDAAAIVLDLIEIFVVLVEEVVMSRRLDV